MPDLPFSGVVAEIEHILNKGETPPYELCATPQNGPSRVPALLSLLQTPEGTRGISKWLPLLRRERTLQRLASAGGWSVAHHLAARSLFTEDPEILVISAFSSIQGRNMVTVAELQIRRGWFPEDERLFSLRLSTREDEREYLLADCFLEFSPIVEGEWTLKTEEGRLAMFVAKLVREGAGS